jgi:tetratricopeptide (TPR) repeat protein
VPISNRSLPSLTGLVKGLNFGRWSVFPCGHVCRPPWGDVEAGGGIPQNGSSPMSKNKWYRKESWTQKDREDFFARHKLARERKKAAYLRIQAYHLEKIGTPEAIRGALELLDLMIKEWPEKIELAMAYHQRATCLESLGQVDEAIIAYRNSFEAERQQPNVVTYAVLEFGMFAIRHNRPDLYQEVLSVLHELAEESDMIFPAQQYLFHAITAIIADEFELKQAAKVHAKRAIEAAEVIHSGFRYHRNVGLVAKQDNTIEARLATISAT